MKPGKRNRVVFAVDNGLPSRVAASILRNQDFDLLAVHLYCDLAAMGEDPATYPSAMGPSDLPAIEKFCESLGVPLKALDVTEETLANVYTPFWVATLRGGRFDGSAAWLRDLLFPHLDRIATARGSDSFATGHFAKRAPELYRYPEAAFDQSRILARLDPKYLAKLTLPVGEVSVEMLMRLAKEIGATPKDDVPFNLEREVRALQASRGTRGRWEWTDEQLGDPRVHARADGSFFSPGPYSGSDEFSVGEHRGIPYFQIGARAPQFLGHYVQDIIPQTRTVIVSSEAGMAVDGLIVRDLTWSEPRKIGVHRSRRVVVEKELPTARVPKLGPEQSPGTLLEYPDRLAEIRLDHPLYGIAPGETLVFFEESRVLGSAIVAETERAKLEEKPVENVLP